MSKTTLEDEELKKKIDKIAAEMRGLREKNDNPLKAFRNEPDERVFKHFVDKDKDLFESFKEGKPFLENLKDKIFGILGIKNKQNINYYDKEGKTPLDYLHYSSGNLKIAVKELGVDINNPNKEGTIPLEYLYNSKEKLKIAVKELGADINKTDKAGKLPIESLASSKEMLKFAVEELGADVNRKNKAGKTVLMEVASKGYDEQFQYLVKELSGTNVMAVDDKGQNILHKIAKNYQGQESYHKMLNQLNDDQLRELVGQYDKGVDGKGARTPVSYAMDNKVWKDGKSGEQGFDIVDHIGQRLPDNEHLQHKVNKVLLGIPTPDEHIRAMQEGKTIAKEAGVQAQQPEQQAQWVSKSPQNIDFAPHIAEHRDRARPQQIEQPTSPAQWISKSPQNIDFAPHIAEHRGQGNQQSVDQPQQRATHSPRNSEFTHDIGNHSRRESRESSVSIEDKNQSSRESRSSARISRDEQLRKESVVMAPPIQKALHEAKDAHKSLSQNSRDWAGSMVGASPVGKRELENQKNKGRGV